MKAKLTINAKYKNEDIKIIIELPEVSSLPKPKKISLMCQKMMQIAELKTQEKQENCKIFYCLEEEFEGVYYASSPSVKLIKITETGEYRNIFLKYENISEEENSVNDYEINKLVKEIAELQYDVTFKETTLTSTKK